MGWMGLVGNEGRRFAPEKSEVRWDQWVNGWVIVRN